MKFVPHIDPALPFSTAVIVDGIAYMSGNIGILPDGSVPPGLDRQSRLALDNMIAALKLAGCGLEDVFKCTVMLADMNDWPAFNQIYLEYFPASRKVRPPPDGFSMTFIDPAKSLDENQKWSKYYRDTIVRRAR